MDPVMVLIHSPLVGPLTWSLVAGELRRRGVSVVVPALVDTEEGGTPFWEQHVAAVVRDIVNVLAGSPLVLIGHSGAGPLLPAIRQQVVHPVAAYIFVDAGIPAAGESRLGLMTNEDPTFARELLTLLNCGRQFPTWREEDLRSAVLDASLRRQLVDEVQPRSLAFFAEAIPVFSGWPDAPCGYLQFSAAYDVPARQARRAGWPFRDIAGGHFQMLDDPTSVTSALLNLVEQLTGSPGA